MLRVRHLLERKGRDVWTVDADAPVLEAIRRMAEHHVGALPVVRQGALVGMVSERDYARKVILLGRSSADTPVAQIMSAPVVSVVTDDAVRHCMALMTDKRIRHLPVIEGDRVLGIISVGDVVKAVISEQTFVISQLEHYITGTH